jgi:23S rRNA pseudouridine1911/1915/1917 synthase
MSGQDDGVSGEASFVVGADAEGERLDVFLVKHVEGLGRAGAKRLIAEGRVRVDGRVRRKGAVLGVGETVSLEGEPELSDFEPLPDPEVPLRVLYEEDDFAVVEKPAGIPTHPLRPAERGTLANAVVARYPEAVAFGHKKREAGLLQRLDTDTSGLLLVARSLHGFDELDTMLKVGTIDKRYKALCQGAVRSPQIIDLPIGHDTGDRRRMRAVTELEASRVRHARDAYTEVLRSEVRGDRSLVEVRARSARRHQVRAHLAAIGHPLVGDLLYGGPPAPELGRHFLHASAIAFRHPTSGEELAFSSPLPRELEETLARDGFR